jgi:hypothetical protein
MAAALFSVTLLLLVVILFLLSCIAHIRKIQKELTDISEEQARQNEDIKNLMIAHYQLVQTLKDVAWIQEAQNTNYQA